MNIKVLGTKGCRNCDDLYEKIERLIKEKNYEDITASKVSSVVEIANYKVTKVPGLVVDDMLVLEGIVPSTEDLIKLIENKEIEDNVVNEAKCCDGACRF